MYLTFEVISANAATLGAGHRKVFSVDGGRIGRSPENDMVLPGVGVHRHHATVRFINGVFFVEGVGTNGIAINDPDRVLPRNEPYPLKSGDKVYIDEYEVAVTASASAPVEPARSAAPAPRPPADVSAPAGRVAAPLISGGDESPEDLDPLRKLVGGGATSAGSAGARAAAQRPVESAWNHSPSLQDQFTPPAPAASNVIPENWDRTSFDRSKLQPPPQPPAPAHRGAAAPAAPGYPPPGSHVPAGTASQRAAAPSAPGATNSAAAVHRAPPATPNRRASDLSSSSSPFDWDGFLREVGVEPSRVPPETAAAMGSIMRSVVQGLIEVLRARSEIKTEFRMPVTQVKVSENNPLKFAANADDAIANLLGRRNPAYLAPKEAFEDALNDVRFHQLAMLAGVRAGFEHLMSRFDPEQLQEMFERQGKRGGLFGGKSTYWERYTERYKEWAADSDDTFRRMFGEEFARAYEQQLSVLKRNRGGQP
jgi:type VI secretion system protein ImpI